VFSNTTPPRHSRLPRCVTAPPQRLRTCERRYAEPPRPYAFATSTGATFLHGRRARLGGARGRERGCRRRSRMAACESVGFRQRLFCCHSARQTLRPLQPFHLQRCPRQAPGDAAHTPRRWVCRIMTLLVSLSRHSGRDSEVAGSRTQETGAIERGFLIYSAWWGGRERGGQRTLGRSVKPRGKHACTVV